MFRPWGITPAAQKGVAGVEPVIATQENWLGTATVRPGIEVTLVHHLHVAVFPKIEREGRYSGDHQENVKQLKY